MTAVIDLVVLVADLDQEQAIRGLLKERAPSLGIRAPKTEYFKHPRHDPGCFLEADKFLQPFLSQAEHALVFLDREGCGREELSAEQIEVDITTRLATSGWASRATAVAIDPELEVWVWSDSPKVDIALGWSNRTPALRDWLQTEGLLLPKEVKPADPKNAFRAALREAQQKPSASIFGRLAREVGLDRCQDRSFLRMRKYLVDWFGAESAAASDG